LYRKCVPGLNGTGCARKRCTQLGAPAADSSAASQKPGSVWWPVFIRSRSRTRICRRFADGCAGASLEKNFSTSSSRPSFPSPTAMPTAVDVKLLLSEYITCGVRASYGLHHPSATTLPRRTSMKLFIASTLVSAACTNARTAADGMP
jgi:hypothetical protein